MLCGSFLEILIDSNDCGIWVSAELYESKKDT